MENAVQALIIVAGVLIGVMIISLGVSLYTSLNEFVEDSQEEIIKQEIKEFNEQFIRYINCDDNGKINFSLSIQDIVTAANTAYENNIKQNEYVTINIKSEINNLEEIINSDSAKILSNELGNEYICTRNDIKINTETGRVYEVNFSRYVEP